MAVRKTRPWAQKTNLELLTIFHCKTNRALAPAPPSCAATKPPHGHKGTSRMDVRIALTATLRELLNHVKCSYEVTGSLALKHPPYTKLDLESPKSLRELGICRPAFRHLSRNEREDITLCYDNMCHLDNLKVAKKPLPLPGDLKYIWLDITKAIDTLHIRNHRDPGCQQNYNPSVVKDKNPAFNTMSCEQTFAWLSRFKKILCAMPKTHFHFYLHRLVKKRNLYLQYCYNHNRRPLFPKCRFPNSKKRPEYFGIAVRMRPIPPCEPVGKSRKIFVSVTPNDTVVELKHKIQDKLGMPVEVQAILQGGREVEASAKILTIAGRFGKKELELTCMQPVTDLSMEQDGPLELPRKVSSKGDHKLRQGYEAESAPPSLSKQECDGPLRQAHGRLISRPRRKDYRVDLYKRKLEKIPNSLPNQRGLLEVAKHIEGKTFGVYLGLKDYELDGIAQGNSDPQDYQFRVLCKWSQRNGALATWRELATALFECENLKMIDRVADLAKQERFCETPLGSSTSLSQLSPSPMQSSRQTSTRRGDVVSTSAQHPHSLNYSIRESNRGTGEPALHGMDASQHRSTTPENSTPSISSTLHPIEEEGARSSMGKPVQETGGLRDITTLSNSPGTVRAPSTARTSSRREIPHTQSGRFSPIHPLSSRDVGFICRLLKDVRRKWPVLGKALGLQDDDLERLSGTDTDCLTL